MNRRDFLKQANCAAVGSTALFNTLLNLKLAGNAAAASSAGTEYKALVCLFLNGGNDSYNTLIPTSGSVGDFSSEYGRYVAIRGGLHTQSSSGLALPTTGAGAALPLNVANTPGRTFGVHPALGELQELFNDGDLAFVSNVGTLVEPTTVSDFASKSVKLPRQLFSHRDQRLHWQTSVPQGGVIDGWGGRTADILNSTYNTGSISMNISLDGENLFQTGKTTTYYSVTRNGGAIVLDDKSASGAVATLRHSAVNNLMDQEYKNLMEQVMADESRSSFENAEAFNIALDGASLETSFPNSNLGRDLEIVAKTMASHEDLGKQRQTFFLNVGGWDMHQELVTDHQTRLSDVAASVKAFWDALGACGLQDKVMVFTASDFSRTLRSNGRGTDHAWGANHWVLGKGVDGGKIYGEYPELNLGAGLDVGSNGRMLPTTSCDEYFAELLQWFGVENGDLPDVLPNIGNFYIPGATPPVGFVS